MKERKWRGRRQTHGNDDDDNDNSVDDESERARRENAVENIEQKMWF